MKYCSKCGQENHNYAKFCVKCGTTFASQNMDNMGYSNSSQNMGNEYSEESHQNRSQSNEAFEEIPFYFKTIYKIDEESGRIRLGKTKSLLTVEAIFSFILTLCAAFSDPNMIANNIILVLFAILVVWIVVSLVIMIPSYIIAFVVKKIFS